MRYALLALGAFYLFFYEYLPPAKRVHLFGDIEGYHYPLLNYAYKSLRQHRLPEWDPTIYSGMSYVGNIQTGLFYPPNWLLYVANHKRSGLKFRTLEMLEILHYWLAFVLAWRWLRRHTRGDLPALLGAALFAVSGYAMAESQHLGVICGYAWFPLGLLAIDQAAGTHDYRHLWKLAFALAMCLLAGFPPTWIAFCFTALVYALIVGRWRAGLAALAAIAFSGCLAAVQLAPTFELAPLKQPEVTYRWGVPGGAFFSAGYFTPNYYDQSGITARYGPAEENYNYLGSAALLALFSLIALRRWRSALPGLLLMAAALWIITDPGNLLLPLIVQFPLVREIVRKWNFLPVIVVAAAWLTAAGISAFQDRWQPRLAWWWAAPAIAAWSLRQWLVWRAGGEFMTGWWTLAEAAIHLAVLVLALSVRQPLARTALVLLTVFVEYKVFGTSRRFNSEPGSVDLMLSMDARVGGPEFTGLDRKVYAELLRHPQYRVMMAGASPGTDFRHYGLSSPQGFDPFLPRPYIEAVGDGFTTNRVFGTPVNNTRFYDGFAVRYILTQSGSPEDLQLAADVRFRPMHAADGYFHVYEYLDCKPAYRFAPGPVRALHWEPERRTFRVRSDTGGDLELIEQLQPGWEGWVDGRPAPLLPARGAFQKIRVPAGEHEVEFRFRSQALRLGAAVTMLSLVGLAACAWSSRASRQKLPSPAGHCPTQVHPVS
ncbi:MAG: hypothetical protein HY821_04120 [Acidobacteria bacterium]|nr:hypothetical protein [Acidobacteriota bacterium]